MDGNSCGHRTPPTDLAVVLDGLAEVPGLEGLVAQAAHSGQAARTAIRATEKGGFVSLLPVSGLVVSHMCR